MSLKSSLQRDLDRFYKQLFDQDYNIREVTKGALSQARAKLNPWAFKRLNEVAVTGFYSDACYHRWHGMRLLSVDGSRLMLPKHPTVEEAFGVHGFGPHADAERSLAMCSLLYDVLNHLTLDAELAPYTSSERDLLMMHLDKVNRGDMLLLDRGYPCFWLLFLLQARGIEFCVRLKDDWWLAVKQFVESKDQESIVEFVLPHKDYDKLKDYPEIIGQAIQCRLIKVALENGETQVLCTSLLDTERYDKDEFRQLYRYRWNQEEAYKLLKSRAELEKFSGKTAKALQQDFHAKIFLLSMCAAFSHPIEEKVMAEHKAERANKHRQKINRTSALANTMDMLVPMFLKRKYTQSLNAFDNLVYNTREIVRPERKQPRPKKTKRPFYMNYKPM